jgi:malonyl-CoA O-methyltransferase
MGKENKEKKRSFISRVLKVPNYYINKSLQPTKTRLEYNKKNHFEKGIEWVKNQLLFDDGASLNRSTNQSRKIDAYFLPTLYALGEKELSYKLAKLEATVQLPDGSFAGISGRSDVAYTAQVIRGFLIVINDMPELLPNLRHACDYLVTQINKEGTLINSTFEMADECTGNSFSEYATICFAINLLNSGKMLDEKKYVDTAIRSLARFKERPDLITFEVESNISSHIFGNAMEALFEFGELDLAKKGIEQIIKLQKENGGIAAFPTSSNWICSTGLAQLAISFYKLGYKQAADKAMLYLDGIQNDSGGFYGSYGKGAKYFPKKEVGVAVKFYLDAYALKIKSDFDEQAGSKYVSRESIGKYDGRLEEVIAFLGDLNEKKVLDVGCGKGAYLSVLMNLFPSGEYYGLDISEEMLRYCPKGVNTSVGSMLSIKYPDSYFDCVLSVEALEHAVNIEAAVKEMVRVLKPKGKIMIIDKNVSKLGVFKIEAWERWFNPEEISNILEKNCVKTNYKKISHEPNSQIGALFIAWEGNKNCAKASIKT